jgi:putative phosphoribosyl transferase
MAFRNRAEAGHRLAQKLARLKGEPVTGFALPRGGVPVAAPIAATLTRRWIWCLCAKSVRRSTPNSPWAVADGESPIIVRNESVIEQARR